MQLLLDHSIVGQDATTLTIRKDREYAACRLCGAIFQSWLNTSEVTDQQHQDDPYLKIAAEIETREWRRHHNLKHSTAEHAAFNATGLTLTPEAANKLAPFGLVPVGDVLLNTAHSDEIEQAMREAPRAPTNDVESTSSTRRS